MIENVRRLGIVVSSAHSVRGVLGKRHVSVLHQMDGSTTGRMDSRAILLSNRRQDVGTHSTESSISRVVT